MIPIIRTLTHKSVIGVGKYKTETVKHAIERKKHIVLASMYYGLSSINFTDDVLNELRIGDELRLKKPSKNKLLWKIYLLQYGEKPRNRELEKLFAKTKPYKKGLLQSYNHGK